MYKDLNPLQKQRESKTKHISVCFKKAFQIHNYIFFNPIAGIQPDGISSKVSIRRIPFINNGTIKNMCPLTVSALCAVPSGWCRFLRLLRGDWIGRWCPFVLEQEQQLRYSISSSKEPDFLLC